MNTSVGLLLAYGAGLWIQYQNWEAIGLLLGGILLLCGWSWRRFRSLLLLLVIAALIGMGWGHYREPHPALQDPVHFMSCKPCHLHGMVVSDPLKKESGWYFILAAHKLDQHPVHGRVWVHLRQAGLVRYGQQIQLQGQLRQPAPSLNFGAFSYQDYLARQHIFSLYWAHKAHIRAVEKNSLLTGLYNYKHWVRTQLHDVISPEQADLLYSLVLGTDGIGIDETLRAQFGQLGLQHILAVSGFQVQLILALLLVVAQRLNWSRWPTALVGSGWVILYMILTGAPASVLRAGCMALLALLGLVLFRQLDTSKGLSVAAALLLLLEPSMIRDVGFQFSVLATWGLLHSSQPLAVRLTWLPVPLAQTIAVPLAAQLWVLPLQLWYFGTFSWLFLPANLLAAMFIPVLTYLVLAAMVCMLFSPLLFEGIALLLNTIWSLFLTLVQGMLQVPDPVIHWFGLNIWSVVLLYILLLFSHSGGRQRSLGQFMLLACLFLSFTLPPVWAEQTCPVRITFLYVEQGDSILIETPTHKVMVDAGPSHHDLRKGAAARHLWPDLQRREITHLDLAFVTHAHEDHYGGLGLLLTQLSIGQIVTAPHWSGERGHLHLLRQLQRSSAGLSLPHLGQRYHIGAGAVLEVLAPLPQSMDEENDRSVVLRLQHGRLKVLLTGDIEAEAEAALVKHHGSTLAADILKVPHHGSRTSSTPALLRAVNPRLAVISAGHHNRFGHPHQDVIARYQQAGVTLKQTNKDGAVCVCSQGERWAISTAVNP